MMRWSSSAKISRALAVGLTVVATAGLGTAGYIVFVWEGPRVAEGFEGVVAVASTIAASSLSDVKAKVVYLENGEVWSEVISSGAVARIDDATAVAAFICRWQQGEVAVIGPLRAIDHSTQPTSVPVQERTVVAGSVSFPNHRELCSQPNPEFQPPEGG